MNQDFEPLKPKVVLCVAAHPDDLEFGVAGSVAKWIAGGAKVYYLILTNGNKGSSDRSLTPDKLRDMRREEQRAAAEILGVSEVYFYDHEDGLLEPTMAVKRDVARTIRQTRPEVIYCMDPTMVYTLTGFGINHSDHRAAGMAALDAAYPLARDHLSFPELLTDEGLEPHKVSTVLMANFDKQNYYEDVTDFLDTKLKALAAHVSQLPDPAAALTMVKQRAAETGKSANAKYAEAFLRLDLPF